MVTCKTAVQLQHEIKHSLFLLLAELQIQTYFLKNKTKKNILFGRSEGNVRDF